MSKYLIGCLRDPHWFQRGCGSLGNEAADEIERLQADNDRLRELLLRCKPQIEAGYGHGRIDRELIMELESEVSDE